MLQLDPARQTPGPVGLTNSSIFLPKITASIKRTTTYHATPKNNTVIVDENEITDENNEGIEEENKQIEEMKDEANKLEKQLKDLEQGGGG